MYALRPGSGPDAALLAHASTGRWGAKGCEALQDALHRCLAEEQGEAPADHPQTLRVSVLWLGPQGLHQLITYLTKQGIISPKLQLLSGQRMEQSLAVYRALALTDVAEEYEAAMRVFPVR